MESGKESGRGRRKGPLIAVFGLAALAVGGPVLAERCASRSDTPQVEAPGPDGGDVKNIQKEILEKSGATTK